MPPWAPARRLDGLAARRRRRAVHAAAYAAAARCVTRRHEQDPTPAVRRRVTPRPPSHAPARTVPWHQPSSRVRSAPVPRLSLRALGALVVLAAAALVL